MEPTLDQDLLHPHSLETFISCSGCSSTQNPQVPRAAACVWLWRGTLAPSSFLSLCSCFPRDRVGKVPNPSLFVTRTVQLGPYRAGIGEISLSCPGVSWTAGLAMSGVESPALRWLWDAHKLPHWSSLVSHGDLGRLLQIMARYNSSITPELFWWGSREEAEPKCSSVVVTDLCGSTRASQGSWGISQKVQQVSSWPGHWVSAHWVGSGSRD